MSIEVHSLGRLRVSREATFGTVVDFSGADSTSILSVPAVENSVVFKLSQALVDPMALVAFKDQTLESVIGLRSATISFTVPAISPGATTNTTAHTRNALGLILRDLMGGENLAEGHTISSVSTAAKSYSIASGNLESDYSTYAGGAVGVPIAGSLIDWRPIDYSGTTAIDLKLATSATIQTSLVYGTSTYYPTEDPSNSLQFAVYGAESDDRWQFLGCQLESMTLELPPGGIPQFAFTFKCASWLHGSSASSLASSYEVTSSITGALAAYTYSAATNYIVNTGGYMYYYTAPTGTAADWASSAALALSSEAWNVGIVYTPVPSPSGVQTIARYVRGRSGPVATGTFNVPYEDVSFLVDQTTLADKAIFRVIGGAAGGTMILDVPTIQITDVQRVDDNGLAYQQVSWKARHDVSSNIGAGDAALQRASFRIHFG